MESLELDRITYTVSSIHSVHMFMLHFLLILAIKILKKKILVFPALKILNDLFSSGAFKGAIDVCAECFLDAVLLFTYDQKGKQCLKEVHLVNNYENSTANMILTIRQMLVKGMDLLTIEAMEKRDRGKKRPGLIAKIKAGISDFLFGPTKGHEATEPPRTSSNTKKSTTVRPTVHGKSALRSSVQAKNKTLR